MQTEFDVIIIGGGITGVGTARDCALRGLRTVLVERDDLTAGATGRNHGLLHSGARYAVTDTESAAECIRENLILKRIASHCIEDTCGLSITLPEDDLSYQDTFVRSCRSAGIDAEILDPQEVRRMEPAINPELIGAVRVPDASVDPFMLTTATALDATLHSAVILTYHEVLDFVVKCGRMTGVKVLDKRSGRTFCLHAPVTVNAAGIWGARLALKCGIRIGMYPAKGSLLIFGHRICKMVVNRCRKPSNADILVPGGVVSMLGTTSSKVSEDECDRICATSTEVDELLREGVKLSPKLSTARVLRAYAGVRPLVASDDDPTGRSISRGIVLLDHESRDGMPGFVTITGGKLTTHRLMAEMATDLVCAKLSVIRPCKTAVLPLPGSEAPAEMPDRSIPARAAAARHGNRISRMDFEQKSEVICQCEHVTRAEIEYAVRFLDVHNLIDLRRRTRIGMGTCQGTFCMGKVAAVLAETLGTPELAPQFVREYAKERWKGIIPVCWGESLREAEYMRKQYGNEV